MASRSSPSSSIRVLIAAGCLLSLAIRSSGHCSCTPCLCDLISNREVAAVARQCAKGYYDDSGAANRTLQLLETISQQSSSLAIQGCQIESRNLEESIQQARLMQHQSVNAALSLSGELLNSPTSLDPAAEYSRQIQDRVGTVASSAQLGSERLSESLGEVLSECFQTRPMAVVDMEQVMSSRISGSRRVPRAAMQEASGDNVALAWGLSLMAGASTVIGSLLVGFATPDRLGYLSFLEAFTAGVMLQGSLSGLTAQAAALVADSLHPTAAFWLLVGCFFAGVGACVMLEVVSHRILGKAAHAELPAACDSATPCCDSRSASSQGNEDAEVGVVADKPPTDKVAIDCSDDDFEPGSNGSSSSKSDGISAVEVESVCKAEPWNVATRSPNNPSPYVIIIGVTLHNMAEGMATFTAALLSTRLGIGLAVAMVLHNIPEGISIAAPYYHASGSRLRGIMWASVAGAAEVLAALVVYLIYLFAEQSAMQNAVFSCLFAVASGMMTYIALYELYPAALAASPHSKAAPGGGIFIGIFIMQITLGQLGIPAA